MTTGECKEQNSDCGYIYKTNNLASLISELTHKIAKQKLRSNIER